jgi:hypothetical protein
LSAICATFYRTSKKRLQNPVFWLELSISTLSTEADWRAVVAHAKGIIREAEKMTIEGEATLPCFCSDHQSYVLG